MGNGSLSRFGRVGRESATAATTARRCFGRVAAALATGVGVLFSLASFGAVQAASAPSTLPLVSHAPRVPISGFGVRDTWAASNWSGYAETGTFAGVTGTWSVPAVASSSSATYSSAWIGVDGFSNSNLIQTGTEEDYYNGAAHYNAWWEILPAAETALPASYKVMPGDRMEASIYETTTTAGGGLRGRGAHEWVITISDATQAWKYSTTQSYSGPGASAEWVMEAPEVNGKIATLAHYTFTPPAGTGDFDNAGTLATAVSGSPAYVNAGLNYQQDSGVMIQKNAQVSTPGDPDSALTAFNAAYGSALPATPSG